MFTKGSRYRNLPEVTPVNAEGERRRGKDLRLIPTTRGRFLHTVRDHDRLDLLAFKYYNEATKWWQIADANPQPAFPTALLDSRPFVSERFVLSSADFAQRFDALLTSLSAVAQVKRLQLNLFDEVRPRQPDFLDATVVAIYAPSPTTHQRIVNRINGGGFHFLRSFAWDDQGRTNEAFTFEDPVAKASWQQLVKKLADTPGVIAVQSVVVEATLEVVYNSAVLSRQTVLALIDKSGFGREPESSMLSRVGTQIIIPPNQTV